MHFCGLSTLEDHITYPLTMPSKALVPAMGLRPSKQPRDRRQDVRIKPKPSHKTLLTIEEAIEMSSTHPDSSLEATSDDDPLARYFDPQTSILHEHIIEPPSPPIATWEGDLQHRIDNERGLTASIDRFMDRAVRCVEAALGHA
ncbi:uncharacterized protein P174DRAFT_457897 [Aspergillus novofumigatus IBT 16806]|uniref:Uncharacterized protein n=1 Tax=Aspergillus novofumigatus (strain IBT 16806) TaxID=1392255 RepID=A0A2I1CHV1_ASPN1|nr:uncharacterized protein P174DRAFT_457897 [Aspergillus novofumigatus IBT 16806]PKX97205.1 hypothetical protein P174DRAFT_457897 [Aspergillus novofumigatus IBT 16806]